jgi:hypothetical protein
MQETVNHSTQFTSSVKFKGTGVFMDEEDLGNKYASKPLQLAAIKQNTRTMWDAVREVKLL